MSVDRTAALFAETKCSELERFARILREECEALEAVLPAIGDAQWRSSPVPTPSEDTTERAKGGHSDPTSAVAIDERRLALREQVQRSEEVIRDAVIAVRGIRRGLEMALAYWGGEQ